MSVTLFRANQRRTAQKALRTCATQNKPQVKWGRYVLILLLILAYFATPAVGGIIK